MRTPRPSAPPDSSRPRLHQLPRRAVASAGDDACAWAESIGWDAEAGRGFYVLDDWQRWCIRGILSEDASARLCAYISLLLVPRQNGKNVILEVVELYALFVLDLRYILHSAHLAETSADHMARLWEAIESDEDLLSRADRTVANGKEQIFRIDVDPVTKRRIPGRIRFRTRSKRVGRGGSPQMVVFDEALYLADGQIQAMLPSLSAQSARPDKPILIYASSAPVAESVVLHRIRAAILRGEMPDAWMAEWSVELPEGDRRQALKQIIDDRQCWLAANPGMPDRIDPEWIAANEMPQMTPEAFAIERLGVVFESDGDSGVLPINLWKVCRDVESDAPAGRLAVAVGPRGAWSAVGFAGLRDDGSVHLEVVRHAPGTDWVVAAVAAGIARYGGEVVIDPKTQGAEVIAALRKAQVPIHELTTPELVQACAAFEGDVRNTHLRHLDQPELNAAVAGVDVRTIGEAWAFSAKASSVDITPLLAVVLAHWAVSADVGAVQELTGPLGA